VVFKPDIDGLEAALGHVPDDGSGAEDRRQRPVRAADGPAPTGVSDAQAFFEALNNAQEGDALVGFEVAVGAEAVADEVWRRLRDTDRVLLVPPRVVRCYLPGGGEVGIRSVLARVATVPTITEGCTVTSVVVRGGEHGADAFDRLKHEGEPRDLASPSVA
jgi:hypothetical protein